MSELLKKCGFRSHIRKLVKNNRPLEILLNFQSGEELVSVKVSCKESSKSDFVHFRAFEFVEEPFEINRYFNVDLHAYYTVNGEAVPFSNWNSERENYFSSDAKFCLVKTMYDFEAHSRVGKMVLEGTEVSSERLYVKKMSMVVGLPKGELEKIVDEQKQLEENSKAKLFSRRMRAKQILECINNISSVTGIPPLPYSDEIIMHYPTFSTSKENEELGFIMYFLHAHRPESKSCFLLDSEGTFKAWRFGSVVDVVSEILLLSTDELEEKPERIFAVPDGEKWKISMTHPPLSSARFIAFDLVCYDEMDYNIHRVDTVPSILFYRLYKGTGFHTRKNLYKLPFSAKLPHLINILTVDVKGTSTQILFENIDNSTVVIVGPGNLRASILDTLNGFKATLNEGRISIFPVPMESTISYIEFTFYFEPEKTIIARFLRASNCMFEIQLAVKNVMQDNRGDTVLWESGTTRSTIIEDNPITLWQKIVTNVSFQQDLNLKRIKEFNCDYNYKDLKHIIDTFSLLFNFDPCFKFSGRAAIRLANNGKNQDLVGVVDGRMVSEFKEMTGCLLGDPQQIHDILINKHLTKDQTKLSNLLLLILSTFSTLFIDEPFLSLNREESDNLTLFLNSQKKRKSIMMFATDVVPKQLNSRFYFAGFTNTLLLHNSDLLETTPHSPYVLIVEGYSEKILLQAIFELDMPLGIPRDKILRWRVVLSKGMHNAYSIIPTLKNLGYCCKLLFDYDVAGPFLLQLIKKIHHFSAVSQIEGALHFGSQEMQKEVVRRKCKALQIFLWEVDLEHMIAQTPEAAKELFSGFQDTSQMDLDSPHVKKGIFNWTTGTKKKYMPPTIAANCAKDKQLAEQMQKLMEENERLQSRLALYEPQENVKPLRFCWRELRVSTIRAAAQKLLLENNSQLLELLKFLSTDTFL